MKLQLFLKQNHCFYFFIIFSNSFLSKNKSFWPVFGKNEVLNNIFTWKNFWTTSPQIQPWYKCTGLWPQNEKNYTDRKILYRSFLSFELVKVNPARETKFFSSKSSWKPKTQPNDSRAAVWLSFWFSTRPLADTVTN